MIRYLERCRDARLAAMQAGKVPGLGGCQPMIVAFVLVVGLATYGVWGVA